MRVCGLLAPARFPGDGPDVCGEPLEPTQRPDTAVQGGSELGIVTGSELLDDDVQPPCAEISPPQVEQVERGIEVENVELDLVAVPKEYGDEVPQFPESEPRPRALVSADMRGGATSLCFGCMMSR